MLIGIGLTICAYFLTWGWDKSLVGLHGFRQAQTALTTYYFIHEGFAFNYQTPVLGKPWSIPFEFPFYQIMVALWDEVTRMDLDAAGRFVSVAFWIACIFPLLGIFRWWVREGTLRWGLLLFLASTFTSIYWADSFMIESTALFLSLVYIYTLVESMRRPSEWLVLLAISIGVAAGLQKLTTFFIACVPAFGFVAMDFYGRPLDATFWRKAAYFCIAVVVPLGVATAWMHHADSLKVLNPLARDFVTSSALSTWNFGTLGQRVSFVVWARIIGIEEDLGLGRGSYFLLGGALLTILTAIWRGRYRMQIVILTAAYLAGPLVFTNLFYIHEYYNFENGIYLNMAFGLALIGLVESFSSSVSLRLGLCHAILLAFSAVGLFNYYRTCGPVIFGRPSSAEVLQALAILSAAGNRQDVILVYGLDWDPTVPYYSERKAIMDRQALPLDDPKIKESLSLLSPDEHIAAMVIGPLAKVDQSFVDERVRRFHLQSTPFRTPWGLCFLKIRDSTIGGP